MLKGVDVSHYQNGAGALPWAAWKASGVEFAIVKLTQGETYTDPWAIRNVEGARGAGMAVAGYHFAVPGNPAAQAAHAKEVAKSCGGVRVWLDMEMGPSSTWPAGKTSVDFADTFTATTGDRLFYSNPSTIKRLGVGVSRLFDCRLWIASGHIPPVFTPWPSWIIHQFGYFGHGGSPAAPGFTGPLDFNRSPASRVQIDALFAGQPVPPSNPPPPNLPPATQPSTTAPPMVAWALHEASLGYREDPPGSNHTPYAQRAHLASLDRLPWCALFLMAGQVETGTSSPITPSVVNSITAAKKAGAWHEGLVDLQPGDYTCRLRTGGGHIEVCVEAPKPNGQWLSVGGNTDSSTDNVNPNGGMVVAQVRQPAGWVGFIRPTRPLV